MRVATYLVGGLASLAWGLPVLSGLAGAIGFGPLTSLVAFLPMIVVPGLGVLFSWVVPLTLRARGFDGWALGAACLSLGIVLSLAGLVGSQSEPVVFLAVPPSP